MELVISAPSADGFIKAIEWNHEEIKEELLDKVAMYSNMVYDENQIKEAKADRAELNKFKKALEDKRKEIKKQCLAPYENFEKQMKEITGIIDKPIGVIDTQIKDFEEAQKAQKQEEIKNYFETKDFHGIFTYEDIADPKWLNATTTMKSIQEAIDTAQSNLEADLQIINDLPEYSFEALEVYKTSRDIRSALAEVKRQEALAKQKQEWEAAKQAQEAEKAKAAEEAPAQIETPVEMDQPELKNEEPETEELPDWGDSEDFLPDFDEMPNEREWTALKVFATPDDMEALKEFLRSRSIPAEFL